MTARHRTIDPGDESSVPSRSFGLVLLPACVAMIGFVMYAALTLFLADHDSYAHEYKPLQRAIRLENSNAAHHNRLGRYLFFAQQDAAGALDHYRRAVELNPFEERYWFDLALADRRLGRTADEKASLESVLNYDSHTPDVLWEVANFDLTRGDTLRALSGFKTVIENDPTMAARAVTLSAQAGADTESILDHAIPAAPEPHLQLLELLMARNYAPAAAKVWQRLLSLHSELPQSQSLGYQDFLLAHGMADDARKVWQQMMAATPAMAAYETSAGNLVVNPGFELEILNGGFDWRSGGSPESNVSTDASSAHSGKRALVINYHESREDSGWVQFVPVKPATHYSFSVFTRTESLQSASLPRIAITDEISHSTLLLSGEVSDSAGWQEARGNFVTGPATRLVTVRIVRRPAEPVVRGRLWLDDFRIVEAVQ